MRKFAIIVTVLCTSAAANATPAPDTQPEHRAAPARTPPCRFVKDYSQEDILNDPSSFISDYLYWENRFHANNISYNTANGMTYDGTQIDYVTGVATEKHPFSAASKEALQLMLFAQALSGSEYAGRFVSPDSNPNQIAHIVTDILSRKLNTYLRFNESFPGFGGMLPWFLSNETNIRPTQDFVNRIPALDNGELLWAVYAVVEALHACPWSGTDELAAGWQAWLDYAKTTAATVFYRGNGTVCAVSTLRNQSQEVSAGTAGQNYSCENGGVLDDPYEGELFTFWLYFFGGLSDVEKEALWVAKRPKLVSVEYEMGGVGPITVQEGFWFSSHEPWKLLEMP